MTAFGRMTEDEKLAARQVVEERNAKLGRRPDSRTSDGLTELVRALRERSGAR